MHEGMLFEDMRPQGFWSKSFPVATWISFCRNGCRTGWRTRGRRAGVPDGSPQEFDFGPESLDRWYAERQARLIAVGQTGSAYLVGSHAADTCDGGSAGGEQPKFSATLRGPDDSLNPRCCKIRGSGVGEASARWADLLIAESVALECLREAGCPVATRLSLMGSWVFLGRGVLIAWGARTQGWHVGALI